MTKNEIFTLFSDDVVARRVSIAAFLQNHENSYEDREEVWKTCPDYLSPEHPWILHLPEYEQKYGEISWFDDFYCDRRQTVDLRDLVDTIDEEEQQKDFIRACVNKGVCIFTLDW